MKLRFHQIRVCCVMVPPTQQSSSLCVNFHQVHICSIPAPAVRSPPKQIRITSVSGRCQSTTQQFSWILHWADRKPRPETTIWYPVTFQNENVLTPAQKSQNRENASSSTNPLFGNTSCCCFSDIPITVVASDYVIIAGAPCSRDTSSVNLSDYFL